MSAGWLLPKTLQHVAGILVTVFILTLSGMARGEEYPVVRDIVFEGNSITQPQTMLREMVIRVGDPADPNVIQLSRQGILDLGLFRDVQVRQEAMDDGVRLVFKVHEKWYVLPYPRLSVNSDGQYGYGAELRWANLWGLNHRLRVLGSYNNDQKEEHGLATQLIASYDAPFLFDGPYSWNFSASHVSTPITMPASYEESITTAQVLATRPLFQRGPASQGWSAGGGLLWQKQLTSGMDAPAAYGSATALVGLVSYRDQHFKVYSEEGTRFDARYEFADRHALSDYSYAKATANYLYQLPIGERMHQGLEFGVEMGTSNNGPDDKPVFSLGGAQGLHAYPRDFAQGDFYYLLSAKYLRPIIWDGVRLALSIEAGNSYNEFDSINDSFYASLGVGVRLRFPQLVNFEVELGYALPLTGSVGGRFYGDRNH